MLVARALAQATELLLLDEPTNHLDVRAALELLELIGKLDISTLCVLHDLNFAAAYCDRIYVLYEGEIVVGGDPQSVLTSALVRDVFGVDTHRLVHPGTGRLLLAFSSPADPKSPPSRGADQGRKLRDARRSPRSQPATVDGEGEPAVSAERRR